MATFASIRMVQQLLLHLQASGVDVPGLLRELGLVPASAFDTETALTTSQLARLWHLAEERTGDPDVGLRAVGTVDLRMLNVHARLSPYIVIQVFATSRNVGEGLRRYGRAYGLTCTEVDMRVEKEKHGAVLAVRMRDEEKYPPSLFEHVLGVAARVVAGFAERPTAPGEVLLRHAARPSTAFGSVFDAKVTFGAPRYGLRFTDAALATPLRTANPNLLAVAESQVEAMLARIGAGDVVRRVADVVRADLATGNVSVEHVAARLDTSVRTLTRQLKAEGTTYRDVVDDVRRGLAHEHLRVAGLKTADVARLLGFAEPNTFVRAFKRWYGVAPSDYRATWTMSR